MSNKQKTKQAKRTKRAQKRAEKQKATRKTRLAAYKNKGRENGRAMAKRLVGIGQAKKLLEDGVHVPDITEDEYIFWLCHGANFIISDEETGVWEPLFEDIYEGRLPAPESIATKVMDRFSAELESDEGLVGVPRSVLAWTVTEKSTIRIYKYEAEKRLKDQDPDCDAEALARQPHNPVTWGVMSDVKKRTMAA